MTEKIFRTITAVLVAVAVVLPHLTWAFEPGAYSLASHALDVRYLGKTIELPAKLGNIEKAFQGQNKTIIHIQDLHCNHEVQRNIARIIHLLAQEHGLKLVGEEGAFYSPDITPIRCFPISEIREAVSDYFVGQGKLTGAEYYGGTGKYPIRLEGIETPKLYEKSLQAVRSFLNSESQGYVLDVREMLDGLKPGIYSAELRAVDQAQVEYREGKLDVLAYATRLEKFAERFLGNHRELPLQKYPNLENYLGNRQEIFGLSVRTNPRVRPGFEIEQLFKEMNALDRSLREALYTSDWQRQLDGQCHRLDVIEKLLNISADQEELQEFRTQREKFKVKTFVDFIGITANSPSIPLFNKAGDRGGVEIDPEIYALDQYLIKVEEFYRLADIRSQHFVANVLKKMDASHENLAVIITGGFHTDEIMAELKKQNIGYVSIKPGLTQQDVANPYFSILQGRKLPLEKLLEKKQTILAPRVFPETSDYAGILGLNFGPIAQKLLSTLRPNQLVEVRAYLNHLREGAIVELELQSAQELAEMRLGMSEVPEDCEVSLATMSSGKKIPVLVAKRKDFSWAAQWQTRRGYYNKFDDIGIAIFGEGDWTSVNQALKAIKAKQEYRYGIEVAPYLERPFEIAKHPWAFIRGDYASKELSLIAQIVRGLGLIVLFGTLPALVLSIALALAHTAGGLWMTAAFMGMLAIYTKLYRGTAKSVYENSVISMHVAWNAVVPAGVRLYEDQWGEPKQATPDAAAALEILRRLDLDDAKQQMAYCQVGRLWLDHLEVRQNITDLLKSAWPSIRIAAIEALAPCLEGDSTLQGKIGERFWDSDMHVRTAVLDAAAPFLTSHSMLQKKTGEWLADLARLGREAAVQALAPHLTGNPALQTMVEERLADPDWNVRAAAIKALAPFLAGDPKLQDKVEERLADTDWNVRAAVVKAMAPFLADDSKLQDKIKERFADPDWHVLAAAFKALSPFVAGASVLEKKRENWFAIIAQHSFAAAVDAAAPFLAGNPEIQEQIEEWLANSDGQIRTAAVDAVAPHLSANPVLKKMVEERLAEHDWHVRVAAIKALNPFLTDDLTLRGKIAEHFAAIDRYDRAEAIGAVAPFLADNPELQEKIEEWFTDSDWQIRSAVVDALAPFLAGNPVLQEKMAKLLVDPDEQIRAAVLDDLLPFIAGNSALKEKVLGHFAALAPQDFAKVVDIAAHFLAGNTTLQEKVEALLADPGSAVRAAAANALAFFLAGNAMLQEKVEALLADSDSAVRAAAVNALGFCLAGNAVLQERMEALLADPDSAVRTAAVNALASFLEGNSALQNKVGELIEDSNGQVREAAIKVLVPFLAGNPLFCGKVEKRLADPLSDVHKAAINALCVASYGPDIQFKDIWSHADRMPASDENYHHYLAYLHNASHKGFLDRLGRYGQQMAVIPNVEEELVQPQSSPNLPSHAIEFTPRCKFYGRSLVVEDASGTGATIYKIMRSGEDVASLQEEAHLLNEIHHWDASVIQGTVTGIVSEDFSPTLESVMLCYHVPDQKKLFAYPLDWKPHSADEFGRWLENSIAQLAALARRGYGYIGILEFYHDIATGRKYTLGASPVGCIDNYQRGFKYANDRANGDIVDLSPDHMVRLRADGKTSARDLAETIRDQMFQLALLAAVVAQRNGFSESDVADILQRMGKAVHREYGVHPQWEQALPVNLTAIAREALFGASHPIRGVDLGHDNGPFSAPGLVAFAETIARSVADSLIEQPERKNQGASAWWWSIHNAVRQYLFRLRALSWDEYRQRAHQLENHYLWGILSAGIGIGVLLALGIAFWQGDFTPLAVIGRQVAGLQYFSWVKNLSLASWLGLFVGVHAEQGEEQTKGEWQANLRAAWKIFFGIALFHLLPGPLWLLAVPASYFIHAWVNYQPKFKLANYGLSYARGRSELHAEDDPFNGGLHDLLREAMPEYFGWDKTVLAAVARQGRPQKFQVAYDPDLGILQFLFNLLSGKYTNLESEPMICLPEKAITWYVQNGRLRKLGEWLIRGSILFSGWQRYWVVGQWNKIIASRQQPGDFLKAAADILAQQVFNQTGLSPAALLQQSYQALLGPRGQNLGTDEVDARLEILQEMKADGLKTIVVRTLSGKLLALPLPLARRGQETILNRLWQHRLLDGRRQNTRPIRRPGRFGASA